jgi:hypothetical protein
VPERRPWGRHGFDRAVLGTTTELTSKLQITAEAYYNGAGARGPEGYLTELMSPRVAIGEAYTLGRIYAGVAGEWQIHPLLELDLAALGNLTDPSAMLAPTLRYGLAENVSLIGGAYLPFGRSPNTRTGAAQSEFGLYPEVYHFDAKLWL